VRPPDEARPSVSDRSFRYGDAVFCTLIIRHGRLLDADAQIENLTASARAIGISVPGPVRSPRSLCAVLRRLGTGASTEAVVRVQVTAGASGRGYARGSAADAWELVELLPVPPSRSVSVAVLSEAESHVSPLPAVKSCNALPHVLCATAAARLGVDEAIRTSGGVLLEGCSANLFWAADGTLFTPAAELPIYPGATRAVVREVALGAGWRVDEGAFPARSLGAARGAFLTNAVRGVEPIAAIDGRSVEWPGELETLRTLVERHREANGRPVAQRQEPKRRST